MKLKLFISVCFLFLSCSVSKKNSIAIEIIKIEDGAQTTEVVKHFTTSTLKDYEISEEFLPAKSQNERIRFLVVHYTGIDMKTSVRTLTQGEVSSHYLVSDSLDNKIHLLVTEDKRAWHAGVSSFKGFSNLNDNSIGIEIVNKGFEIDSIGKLVFKPYPVHQISKVSKLIKDVVNRYKIDSTSVIGHSDIAPQRKFDPGPLFPWKELYNKEKIGAWYNKADKTEFLNLFDVFDFNSKEFIKSVQEDLNKYGYEINISKEWDLQTKNVIRAFQYHFNPSAIEFGLLDKETWSILKALNKKYRK